jgi:hypothetical protein
MLEEEAAVGVVMGALLRIFQVSPKREPHFILSR